MRILLLSDHLPPDSLGGLELSAAEIGAGLASKGHDVQFVCSQWRTSFKGQREVSANTHRILRSVDVRERPSSRLPRKLESVRAIERKINIASTNYRILRKYAADHGPFDLGLVFGVLSIGLGTVRAFTDLGIPVVWSIGDVALAAHFALPEQTKLYKLAFKTLGRRWHAIEKRVDYSRMIFVSEFARGEALRAGFEPTEWAVIPRAVNFGPSEYKREAKDDPPTIFVASRLAPSRGAHVVLEAVRLLAERRPDLRWTLGIAGTGDSEYVAGLEALARRLGGRVSFLGRIGKDQVIEHMRRASIVVNPTVEVEGFGRANIEALACGVALVASDVPTIHEIAGDSGCALIYPPNDPGALSAHLERLLADPGRIEALAAKGIAVVRDRYLFAPVIDEFERFLLQIRR